MLDIKRENPISAVTFCVCSRNIQGLYIKARQRAQRGKGIKSVFVFVNKPIEFIEKTAYLCDIIQLHGDEDDNFILQLQKKFPQKKIWKVFKIKDKDDLEIAKKTPADMVLLDNGYGTGEVFDWRIIGDFDREKHSNSPAI